MMTIVIIFSNEFSGIPSEWHTVWILIRPTVLTVFIQIQTVFKLSLAGKKVNMMHTGDRRLLKRAWTSAGLASCHSRHHGNRHFGTVDISGTNILGDIIALTHLIHTSTKNGL